MRAAFLSGVFAAFCGALSLSSAALAEGVALRVDPVASSSGVTLGDLFEGAGRAGGTVVAPAPRPGSSTVLDAGRVQAAARQAGLEWDNATGLRRVIVRSAGAPAAVSVASASGVAAAARAAPAEVLVWARNINTGEIVAAEDLTWGRAVGAADAADPDAIIGLAARRPLRAGIAATGRDVSAPMVIGGETVQVDWRGGGITPTLQGQAQGSAAAGEPFRVLNLVSRRTVDVVATGPGQAVAGPEAERLRSQRLLPGGARVALR